MSRTEAHIPWLGPDLVAEHDHSRGVCDLPERPKKWIYQSVRDAGSCYWWPDFSTNPKRHARNEGWRWLRKHLNRVGRRRAKAELHKEETPQSHQPRHSAAWLAN